MTEMPELIALLHSFVGLAAVLVGWKSCYLEPNLHGELTGSLLGIHHAEVFIGVFIGAVTLTGSIVAYLKLSGKMKSLRWCCRARTSSTPGSSWPLSR